MISILGKTRSDRKPLTPHELAAAAVLADLSVLTVVMARLTPLAAMASVLGSVPYAVLARNHRGRVVLTAFWVGLILTFLLAGFGAATQVVVMALFGFVAGRASRDGRSRLWSVGMSVLIGWTVVASLTFGFLFLFDDFRRLSFEAALVQIDGASVALERIGLGSLGDGAVRAAQWMVEYWMIGVPLFQLGVSVFLALFLRRVAGPVLHLVARSTPRDRPKIEFDAELAETLTAPGLTVVVGENGSGKTTLLNTLAHQSIDLEDGESDLGLPGGVAIIGQRPESQIVGARVRDDLSWGLVDQPSPEALAVVLDRVGLAGFEDVETTTLSGGQMQRLAIAAAILRKPRLLLSDESTAMLDPDTRTMVRNLLIETAKDGAVVHTSHLPADRNIGSRLLDLDADLGSNHDGELLGPFISEGNESG